MYACLHSSFYPHFTFALSSTLPLLASLPPPGDTTNAAQHKPSGFVMNRAALRWTSRSSGWCKLGTLAGDGIEVASLWDAGIGTDQWPISSVAALILQGHHFPSATWWRGLGAKTRWSPALTVLSAMQLPQRIGEACYRFQLNCQ